MTISKQWSPQVLQKRQELASQELLRRKRANPLRYWHPLPASEPGGPQIQVEAFGRARRVSQFAFLGANRLGKSVWGAANTLEHAISLFHEEWSGLPYNLTPNSCPGKPKTIWCVGLTYEKSVRGQQLEISKLLPPAWCKRGSYDEKNGYADRFLQLTNGTQILFKSADQDPKTFESEKVDFIWLDEAIPKNIYLRCLARLVDNNGKLILTTIRELPWFEEVFVENLVPGMADYISGNIFSNTSLSKQGVDTFVAALGALSEDQYKMRVLGEPIWKEGLVYKEFNRENLVEPFPIPEDWTLYEVVDPGLQNPCGVLFVAIDPQGDFWAYDEIYVRDHQPTQVAELIRGKRLRDGRGQVRQPVYTLIDPGARQKHQGMRLPVIDQFREAGIPCVVANNELWPGIQRVKAWLKPYINGVPRSTRLHVFQTCTNLRYEFNNYMWGPMDEEAGEYLGDKEEPIDRHNHLLAGVRYLINAEPRWIPPKKAAAPTGTLAAKWEEEERQRARERARGPWKR